MTTVSQMVSMDTVSQMDSNNTMKEPLSPSNKEQLVEKTFYFEEQRPKIFRIFTITYIYDRVNNVLSYGASIYKDDGSDQIPFDKRKHRQTALKRLNMRPVIINNVMDDGKLHEFHEKIRHFIYKHGVRGKKL